MPSIVSYRKTTDATTTYTLALPEGAVELATIGDTTYVSLPDGAILPPHQAPQIAASIDVATLDPALRASIKQASPHCQLIATRMIDQLRAAYSLDDEMYFARIGVGAATGMYVPSSDELQEMAAFGEFVESVRQWGRGERVKLGL